MALIKSCLASASGTLTYIKLQPGSNNPIGVDISSGILMTAGGSTGTVKLNGSALTSDDSKTDGNIKTYFYNLSNIVSTDVLQINSVEGAVFYIS